MSTEPTNKDRAERAKKAVEAYDEARENRGDCAAGQYETPIVDLLADLRHLCDERELCYASLSVTAEAHHRVETAEAVGGRK
jgi:hypothetical protein